MKSVISGIFVAFSMYSAIPVPQVNWEKKTMRWALIFLPLVGIIISTVSWIWFAFCSFFRANSLFYAVGATLIPLCISGGIHLDGLCDTCDALCSFGDREKRLAILKDPHPLTLTLPPVLNSLALLPLLPSPSPAPSHRTSPNTSCTCRTSSPPASQSTGPD